MKAATRWGSRRRPEARARRSRAEGDRAARCTSALANRVEVGITMDAWRPKVLHVRGDTRLVQVDGRRGRRNEEIIDKVNEGEAK